MYGDEYLKRSDTYTLIHHYNQVYQHVFNKHLKDVALGAYIHSYSKKKKKHDYIANDYRLVIICYRLELTFLFAAIKTPFSRYCSENISY